VAPNARTRVPQVLEPPLCGPLQVQVVAVHGERLPQVLAPPLRGPLQVQVVAVHGERLSQVLAPPLRGALQVQVVAVQGEGLPQVLASPLCRPLQLHVVAVHGESQKDNQKSWHLHSVYISKKSTSCSCPWSRSTCEIPISEAFPVKRIVYLVLPFFHKADMTLELEVT